MTGTSVTPGSIFHIAGGADNAMSLAQLTAWCDEGSDVMRWGFIPGPGRSMCLGS